jgi:ATP synthase protein I
MPRLEQATSSWLFFAGPIDRPAGTHEASVQTDDRHVVLLTLLAQLGVSLGTSGLLWWWLGPVAAKSALLGGLTVVIPNGFLAARLLGGRDSSAKALLRSAWIGEAGKLVLTALLFGVIFAAIRPLSAPAVFAGFIAAQLVIFATLALGARGGGGKKVTTKS